jgi:hypothetical protein
VAVRDLVVHPRDHDLVLATHGRGIWIVDDLTPLRALTPKELAEEAAFLPTRPQRQRIQGQGGWVDGDAAWTGPNAPSGMVITYYQRTRHLFGKLKLEVWDSPTPAGIIIDAILAAKIAKDRGIGGPILSASSYFMKSPPEQYADDVCRELVEKFIRGEVER